MRYLLKIRRYDGSESVIASYASLASAVEYADWRNQEYQSGQYYVEPFDEAKVDWPDISDPKFADLLARLKNRT